MSYRPLLQPEIKASITGTFSKNLRYLRHKHGYTLHELTGESGVCMATIQRAESGRKGRGVNLDTAVKLARVFEVTVDDMATRDLTQPWHNSAHGKALLPP